MANREKELSPVSMQALRRLPYYLSYLKTLDAASGSVSAPVIAKALNLNEVQVRKDLAAVSLSGGKPKTGFLISELIRDLEEFLGYDNVTEAVLVGVGQLGRALLFYKGFDNYGLKIVVAFDNNEEAVGADVGRRGLPHEKLKDPVPEVKVQIGNNSRAAPEAQKVLRPAGRSRESGPSGTSRRCI
jgi:redox-sensing transcriptional repressor